MAVGRLPRNQRNIGGTGRRPRTQRTSGDATTVQTPPRRRLRSGAIQYPAVRWEATLREPVGVVPAGPRMFVVDVVGNTDLRGAPIDLRIESRDGTVTGWHPAAWLSTDGNRGTCTAHVARPPAGRGTVVVRPHAAGQQPTLYAGRIVIQ